MSPAEGALAACRAREPKGAAAGLGCHSRSQVVYLLSSVQNDVPLWGHLRESGRGMMPWCASSSGSLCNGCHARGQECHGSPWQHGTHSERSPRRVDNGREGVALQRGTADKEAVNVGLLAELLAVLVVDGPAIQDAD